MHRLESAEGVGYEPDVFTLSQKGGSCEAKQLTPAELKDHDELIDAAQDAMRSIRDRIQGKDAPQPVENPKPPTMN